MSKKLFLTAISLILGLCSLSAQTWDEPQIPAVDLSTVTSSTVVYLYNVDADAFFINGLTSNTQACATRLTNGDRAESSPQRCAITLSDTVVRIRLKTLSSYLSCSSSKANAVSASAILNSRFAFYETSEGSHIYNLWNTNLKANLDVAWPYGGPLTLVDGQGYTRWAFIPETSVTDGSYALYKSKRMLYSIFKALKDAGETQNYVSQLADAYTEYVSDDATVTSITNASRTLFSAVYASIEGGLDVSFMLKNADMAGSVSVDGWNLSAGTYGWAEYEKYHATYTLEQDNTLPMGTYDIGFHSLYREDGTGSAPAFVVTAANTVKSTVPNLANIDFGVTNATDNGWISGTNYFQPNVMQSCSQALANGASVAWANGVNVGGDGNINLKVSVNTSAQWFNWQGFRVIYKGVDSDALRTALQSLIDNATAKYDDGSGNGADELKSAIDTANAVCSNEAATKQQLGSAVNSINDAITAYINSNASADNPIDKSELIANPSFENGTTGWTSVNMSAQTNSVFSIKDQSTYMEKWISKGSAVGDAELSQTLTELPMGIYQLKVKAQNIQEDTPNLKQRGAWIFANADRAIVTTRSDVTLTFTNIETDVTVGFLAQAASGNWIACDHFRLYYIGGTDADFKEALQAYIDKAKQYAESKMHTSALEALNAKITAAEAELAKEGTDGYVKVSTPLRLATDEALNSIEAFEALKTAIDNATTIYGDGTALGAADFLEAINTATQVYNDGTSSYEALEAQIEALDDATLLFRMQTPTGKIPTIVSDKRFARGATMAFGRFTYQANGAQIKEAGFCFSTEHNPTVLDAHSTRTLSNNGTIYVMDDLTPATVYYARPFVITAGYQVAYGDELKIITIPKGNMTWSYNNGGSAEENARINSAIEYGMYVWNNLMSVQGFHLSASYGSGTPTADCSYGGSMRIGPNSSYQRTGTIMHECAHGVGVGTISGWWTLLVNGAWTGDRANDVLKFWDNNDEARMYGDSQHMWPYGINGASEDNGSTLLYYGNALIIQGLHEDGVAPTSGCFASPAYTFYQEDTIKYYIKSESTTYGRNTSFLTQSGTTLKWIEATTEEAINNDAYAWYLSFDPKTQFYSFRNASTGAYITYSSGSFRTVTKTTGASTTEKFQLMKGREDVTIGSDDNAMNVRGYWILKANGGSATAMTGAASGAVSSASFDISNDATAQRWIILSADEAQAFDDANRNSAINDLNELIAQIKKLEATPHTEDTDGADDAVGNAIVAAQAVADNANLMLEAYRSAYTTLRQAGLDFIGSATPESVDNPFDITFLIADASIETGEGWNGINAISVSCTEFYQTTFDLYQTIEGLPAATYKLMAQAFNRPGQAATVWSDYQNGKNNSVALIYAGTKSQKVVHIAEGASKTKVHSDDLTMTSPAAYVPNTMSSAAAYFAKGYYDNALVFPLTKTTNLKVGIKQTTSDSYYWTIIDNFRLYCYGSMSEDTVTPIDEITVDDLASQSATSLASTTCKA